MTDPDPAIDPDADPGTEAGVDPEADARPSAEEEQAPLLTLRDGLPGVIETPEGLAAACTALAAASGPVAVDAERASGYRYSARAYLVQLRRTGAGTFLVDPTAFDGLGPLQEAIGDAEWILHAATQDIPCLRDEGMTASSLFDTELAGRLLGYPRVGLGTLVEEVLGQRMRKEHSASDWSTRPLPQPWLEYAALDVEVLVELRDALAAQLEESGKATWARQEFDHLLDHQAPVRQEPWRRTSGMHKVRGRRGLGAVREVWQARDEIARERDVTPGRIIPDQAIVVAAREMPGDRGALLGAKGFHGRGAARYAKRWLAALETATGLPDEELPARSPRHDGPPVPRAWAERDPVAARRLTLARAAMVELAEQIGMPVENVLTPDHLRRTLWEPPATRDPAALAVAVGEALGALGSRPWQVERAGPLLVAAILQADEEPAQPGGEADPGTSPGTDPGTDPGPA